MTKPRARDLGIPFEGSTGTHNAITDVSGVTVGYATVIEGNSARTGVTIIHPHGNKDHNSDPEDGDNGKEETAGDVLEHVF